jgi:hypothetical protein
LLLARPRIAVARTGRDRERLVRRRPQPAVPYLAVPEDSVPFMPASLATSFTSSLAASGALLSSPLSASSAPALYATKRKPTPNNFTIFRICDPPSEKPHTAPVLHGSPPMSQTPLGAALAGFAWWASGGRFDTAWTQFGSAIRTHALLMQAARAPGRLCSAFG